MSTLRTTNVIHGSSAVSNLVLDNQGRSIFGPDGPQGRAALYVNAQTNRVGVNTESPAVALDVDGAINATGNVAIGGTLDVTGNIGFTGLVTGVNASFTGNVNIDGDLTVDTNTLFVDSANNRVGVGTTSPTSIFHIQGSNPVLTMRDSDTLGDNISSYILFEDSSGNDRAYIGRAGSSDLRVFGNGDTVFATGGIATSDESMRLDSSGRLLIGTSTALSSSVNNKFQIAAASSSGVSTIQDIFSFNTGGGVAALTLNRSNSNTLGNNTLVTSGQTLGIINFTGADGANYVRGGTIACVVDGTPGTNDMPGRLEFSTTADSGSNSTLRMTIDSSGKTLIGTAVSRTSGAGQYARLYVQGISSSTDLENIVAKFGSSNSNGGSRTYLAVSSGYSLSNNDTEGQVLIGAIRNGTGNTSNFSIKTYEATGGQNSRFWLSAGGNSNGHLGQASFERSGVSILVRESNSGVNFVRSCNFPATFVASTTDGGSNTCLVYWQQRFGANQDIGCMGAVTATDTIVSSGTSVSGSVTIFGFVGRF